MQLLSESRPVALPRSAAPLSLVGTVVAVGFTGVLLAGVYLGLSDPTSGASQNIGNVSILIFALVAGLACAQAARQRTPFRRGWTLLALSILIWATAQAIYTFYGVTRNHRYPFPSIADVGFLLYAVPAIAGLFCFPRPPSMLISRLRAVLDVGVIAMGVLFVAWGTVLQQTHEVLGKDTALGLTGLAYPLVDVTVCSVVLTLGMRQPPGERLPWFLLGGGIVTLAVSDSAYVRLLADGHTAVTGTPLAVGWMTAFLLITVATLVPLRQPPDAPSPVGSRVLLQLIPYVPVLGAIVVAAGSTFSHRPINMLMGLTLLLLVIARQVLIVYENVALTGDLEAKVAARTAELNAVTSAVTAINAQMEAAQAIARVGSWQWRGATGTLDWSREFYRLLDLPEDCTDTDAELFMTRVHPDDLPLVEKAKDALLNSPEGVQAEFRIIRPDGDVRNIQARAAVVGDLAEGDWAMVGTMQDVTQLLEVERLKDEFVSVVSHELRTPLTSVRGVLGLLAGGALGPLSDQAQHMIGVAMTSAERLTRLINGILDAERIAAGKLSLDVAHHPAGALVTAAVAEIRPIAEDAGVMLTVERCEGTVEADQDRILQTLVNLLSNAVRFSPAGGVVRIGARTVSDTEIEFSVADQGRGVPADKLKSIFGRFEQVDASDARDKDGTGLGLHICQGIVEQHGGRIWVASGPGGGSTFCFTLPRVAVEAASLSDRPTADVC